MDKEFWDEFILAPPGKIARLAMRGCRARSFHCSKLGKPIDLRGGKKIRLCKWCNVKSPGKSNAHYCSVMCRISCYIWLYPGRDESRGYIMHRQEMKCDSCGWQWDSCWGESGKDRSPEIDHVVAIMNGGESLGVDNHRAICRLCHKGKTKKDHKKLT